MNADSVEEAKATGLAKYQFFDFAIPKNTNLSTNTTFTTLRT